MKTILIVDGRREVRDLLGSTLASKGHKILEAESGHDALSRARDVRPDLIIMGIKLPGAVDGIQATQIVKSYAETRHTKVIVLSGTEDPRAPEQVAKAGADAFFSRPFSPLDLLRKMDELLG